MTHFVESVFQQQGGTLSLIECTLIEELDASDEDCEYLHTDTHQTTATLFAVAQFLTCMFTLSDNAAGQGFNHLEFKIVVEPPDGQSFSVVLLAPSRQEKAAWTSDISQVGPTVWSCWISCAVLGAGSVL